MKKTLKERLEEFAKGSNNYSRMGRKKPKMKKPEKGKKPKKIPSKFPGKTGK